MTATEYTAAYRVHSDRIGSSLLAARLAATRRHEAAEEYRRAVVAAHRCGASYSELAAVIGVSRQAVRSMVLTSC